MRKKNRIKQSPTFAILTSLVFYGNIQNQYSLLSQTSFIYLKL